MLYSKLFDVILLFSVSLSYLICPGNIYIYIYIYICTML